MAREAVLCFVEADEFLEFPRPLQSNVIPLGPFGLEDPNDESLLKAPFDVEMAKGREGVALVSLGTHASTRRMPKDFVRNLLRAMGEHPQVHFILKVDKEEVVNKS
jgi:hypothetical protein